MRRNPVAAFVAAVGVCGIFAGITIAEVREPIAVSVRYTAKRGSSNLSPTPTTLEQCRAQIEAAYRAEGRTRTGGSSVYQCVTTESHIINFIPAPVTPPPPPPGPSAVLSWTPPTRNVDGSALSNLSGYRVHYGRLPGELVYSHQVANPSARGTSMTGLAPGVWYFAVRAYSPTGESRLSEIWTRTVQ